MVDKARARRPRDGREVLASLVTWQGATSDAALAALGPRRRPGVKRVFVALAAGAALAVAVARYTANPPARAEPGPAAVPPAPRSASSPASEPAPDARASPSVLAVPVVRATPSPPQETAPSVRGAAAPPPVARVRECRGTLHALPTPAPGSRDGILTVEADPFGEVFVNGRAYGETPRECRVSAGAYVVRTVHPKYGAREARLVVRAGERASWTAEFLTAR